MANSLLLIEAYQGALMLKAAFAVLLTISGIGIKSWGRPLCAAIFSNEFEFFNTNGDIPAGQYNRPHYRGLEMYENMLGPLYKKVISELKDGDMTIDAGAGYGLSSIQIAQKKHVTTHAINVQDFWSFLKSANHGQIKNRLAAIADQLKIDLLGTIPKSKFMGVQGYYYGYDWQRASPQMVVNARKVILDEVARLQSSGKFFYHADFVERVLPKIEGSAKVIQDLYGAFLYSSDRMHILDQYYEKLSSNGYAFIKLKTNEGNGVNDTIRIKGGLSITLADFLISEYPRIFAYGSPDRSVLVMRRDSSIESLNLESDFAPEKISIANFSESEYPVITWKPRK